MSFNDWDVLSLEDTCFKITDGSHFSPKGVREGYPMLTVKDMRDYGFDYSSCKKISKDDFDKMISNDCVPIKNDVLVAKDGSYLKHIFTVRENRQEAVLSSIAIFRPNTKIINSDYLKYFIINPVTKKMISENYVSGSAIPRIVLKDFKKIKIKVPSLEEQQAIARLLSTLDEKIEVNKQINKNLENMAQEIFKKWFVDFEFPNEEGEPYKSSGGKMVESELGLIPVGWEVVQLKDIANITMGQSPKGSSYNEDGIGEVFYQGRTDFTQRYPNRRLFTTEPKRMANKGDILMSVRAPVGDLNIANEICCIGRGLSAINSKNENNSFLFYGLMKLKNTFDVYNGEGTIFGSINKNDLKSVKVIRPFRGYVREFEKIVSQFDKEYLILDSESRNLMKLRDTILPKLMSGEIRVPSEN
ncbi:type I restriction enzyme S subunit [Trichococcus patagoniensis]|uniref:Type I restriction enzyme S subunit n=1 Tax=Trichococcus patagoniensis TaxID=382641 RepID=A0A2T5IL04_9LACT|nr:restriction endonuclease subunit S [Trichococcus patagoniensis]PTQ84501.1 type I restriction enzyme S subunit [Trichococcus patagoniensis]